MILVDMTALFLLVWFYLYAGLLFGMCAKSAWLFPKVGSPWQVLGWPVFLGIHLFNQLKDSNFGWFVRYQVFKAKN